MNSVDSSVLHTLLFVIVVLSIGQAGTLILWYMDHHALIDKLMSRSYSDYVQAQVYQKNSDNNLSRRPLDDEAQVDDQTILQELNGMLGT